MTAGDKEKWNGTLAEAGLALELTAVRILAEVVDEKQGQVSVMILALKKEGEVLKSLLGTQN